MRRSSAGCMHRALHGACSVRCRWHAGLGAGVMKASVQGACRGRCMLPAEKLLYDGPVVFAAATTGVAHY